MKTLIAYFSRTGHSEILAKVLGRELEQRGHPVYWEVIEPVVQYPCFREISRDFPRYPSIACSLISSRWRDHHILKYNQVEEDIQPLKYPDVSSFERICIGGPKWAQISYPVARYLKTIGGIQGKKVGSFATFGGPPLNRFEIEFIERSMARKLKARGADLVANAYVSSAYHEGGFMLIFRLICLLRFGKSIDHFVMGSKYAHRQIQSFCDDLS